MKKRYSFEVKHGTSSLKAGFYRDEAFDGIATEVGAEAVTEADLKNVIMSADVSDLPLPCINFTYEVGGKKKSSYSYFSSNKTPESVASALLGKTYNGGPIVGVSYPGP